MKRMNCLYALVIGLFLLSGSQVLGHTLSASDVGGLPGGTVILPVSIDVGDEIAGIQFTLFYDDNLLTPNTTVATTTALTSGWTLQTNTTTSGTVIVGLFDSSMPLTGLPVGSKGEVVELIFDVNPLAPIGMFSFLSLGSVVLADINADINAVEVPADSSGGSLEIAGTPAISGRVTEQDGATGIGNAEVVAINTATNDMESVRTDASGRYLIGDLAVGTYKVGVITHGTIYIPEFYNDKSIFSTADLVTTLQNQETTGIDFLLDKDSDKDGIPDSEELVSGTDGFITDENLADTDADGVDDRAEILAGTDPTIGTSVPAAQDLYIAGKKLLAELSFMEANAAFGAAVGLDPNHVGANFFYGMTRVLAFFNSDSFLNLLRGFSLLTNGLTPLDEDFGLVADFPEDQNGNIIYPTDFPTGAAVQTLLASRSPTLLTEVEEALGNLTLAANQTFSDSIIMDNVLFHENVEFDYGDVLAWRSFLKFMRSQLLALGAYDVNLDIDEFLTLLDSGTEEQTADFIHNNPNATLGGLKTSNELATAKTALSEAIDDYLAASTFIRSETDDQSNDFFTIDPDELLDEGIIRQMLTDLKQALSGPAEVRDLDPFDDEDDALPLNLSNFYTNTIADLKTLIPTSSDVIRNQQTNEIIDILFPDETFHGILQFSTISGTVVDNASTEPVPGLSVFTFALDRNVDEQTYTDFNGAYTLDELLTGNYIVCVDDMFSIFRFTCFDNAVQNSTAAPVGLSIDEQRTGVDFSLQGLDSVVPSVQFKVHNVNNNGTMETWLEAFVSDPDGTVPNTITSVTVTGPTGSGIINELLIYTNLPFFDPRYRKILTGAAMSGTYTVTVTDIDTNVVTGSDTITATTLPMVDSSSFSITNGQVLNNRSMIFDWRGLVSSADLYYRTTFRDTAGDTVAASDVISTTEAVISGGALTAGSSFTVRVNVYDGKDFFDSDNITISDAVSFSVDSAAGGPGAISGYVIAYTSGFPVEGVTVVASDYATSQPLASAVTGTSGIYQINGLPPGTYRVGAFPPEARAYQVQYYSMSSFSNAMPVTVSADATTWNISFDLEEAGRISGVVFDENLFTPIEGVRVTAFLADTNELVRSDITDNTGNYSLSGLPPGDYILRAMDLNGQYLTEHYDNVILFSQAARITVSAYSDTQDVDFSLGAGGAIAGTVTAGVQPVDGDRDKVQVFAFDADTGDLVNFAMVKSDGTYLLPVFSPGTYRLLAQPFKAGIFGELLGLASQWYDGTASGARHFGDAANVQVASSVAGKDFALAQGGTVSGWAIDSFSQTVFGARAEAYDFDTGFLAGFTDRPDYSGQYSMELPLGRYRIYFDNSDSSLPNGFFVSSQQSAEEEPDAVPVELSTVGEVVSDIDFKGGDAGAISGTVDSQSSGQPVKGILVEARDYFNDGFVKKTRTDSLGRYSLKNLPAGSYRILIRADTKRYTDRFVGSSYISQRHGDTLEASTGASPIPVTSSSNLTGFDFNLLTDGFIEGTIVRSSDNAPVQGILVLAEDATASGSEFDRHELKGFAHTNADGTYRINVPAGTYRVSALDLRPAPRYAAAAFTGQVTVTSGGTTIGTDMSMGSGGLITGNVFGSSASTTPLAPVLGVNVVAGDSAAGEPVAFNQPIYDGSYVLRVLAGTYKANIDPIDPSIAGQFYDEAHNFLLADSITVSNGLTTSGIDFPVPLTKTAISGVATDSSTTGPISGVRVVAQNLATMEEFTATTGADGRYAIGDLSVGDYRVGVITRGTVYQPQFYNNVQRLGQGAIITTVSGELTSTINFSLDADTDSDGLPDSTEANLGSNPNNLDSDADKVNDWLENYLSYSLIDANSTPTIPELIQAGKGLLNNEMLWMADAAFQAALDLAPTGDPGDPEANLYRAATRIALLLQDDTLNSLLDRLGFSLLGRDLFDIFGEFPSMLPASSPSGQELSDLARNIIIPALSASITNLDNINDANFNISFSHVISKIGVAGVLDPNLVEIDYADVKIISSMLGFQGGLLELATANNINFDIDNVLNILESQGLGNMLEEIKTQLNSSATLLSSNTIAQLNTAKTLIAKAISDYLDGSSSLRQETDNQIDDLFQISMEDEQIEQRFRDVLNDVLPFFNNNRRVTIRDLDTYGVDSLEDLERNDSFTLDLRHLFGSATDSIAPPDWRTLLLNSSAGVKSFLLGDDTVDGILPEVNHPVTSKRVAEGTAFSSIADAFCDNIATLSDYVNLGVPFIPLAGADTFTVFQTLLGPRQAGSRWRLFSFDSVGGSFKEITAAGDDTLNFNTGYFIIASNGCITSTVDFGITGIPAVLSGDFTFSLEPDSWTLFSNPFHFEIALSNAMSSDNPLALSSVFRWKKGVGSYEVTDKLFPSESYFMYNFSSSPVNVTILPVSAETQLTGPNVAPKSAKGKVGVSAKYQSMPPALGPSSSGPYADVRINDSRLFAGDTLRVTMNLYNPETAVRSVDVYVWLNDSEGNLYIYDPWQGRFVEGSGPTIASFRLPEGDAITGYEIVRHLLVKQNPLVAGKRMPGNYSVSISITEPGGAEPIGGRIDSAAFTIVEGKR